MQLKYGGERKVFIFNKIIIKIPYTWKGWLSNINEIYNWHTYKDLKYIMCPILFHDLLGIFIIMRKANQDNLKEYENYLNTVMNKHKVIYDNIKYPHPVLNDTHYSNLGVYEGKLVKIDYGNWFWLYNIYVDIKNKLNNIRRKIIWIKN